MLLLTLAFAGELNCPEFSDLPEARTNALEAESGIEVLYDAVIATNATLVFDCCVVSDCTDPHDVLDISCVETRCTTVDGVESDVIEHHYESEDYLDSIHEDWSLSLTAPGALGLGWTSASASESEETGYDAYSAHSTQTVWRVVWVGTLDAALPSDVSAGASEYQYSDALGGSSVRSWTDSTCSFSAGSYYDWERMRIILDNGAHVASVDWGWLCSMTYQGVTGSFDGVDLGELDSATWEPLADTDGDGTADEHDCQPADPAVSPCLPEVPHDGLDNDCVDGDELDADHDGVDWPADCNDEDAAIFPGARDPSCDGLDQDCDGIDPACWDAAVPCGPDETMDGVDQDCDDLDGPDHDHDGYVASNVGGTDCDDSEASIHPGARDAPCDGVDQNCDGADGWRDCDHPRMGTPPEVNGDTGAAAPPMEVPRAAGCGGSSTLHTVGLVFTGWALLSRRRRPSSFGDARRRRGHVATMGSCSPRCPLRRS